MQMIDTTGQNGGSLNRPSRKAVTAQSQMMEVATHAEPAASRY